MILGIAGGVTVFVLVLIVILYTNSDFDQQLINEVDSGVPADKLIPQIDQETEKLKLDAQRRLESHVINTNSNMKSNDYESYEQTYQNEMKMISEYDDARKKFAERQITKEQFLQEIKTPKELLQMMQ